MTLAARLDGDVRREILLASLRELVAFHQHRAREAELIGLRFKAGACSLDEVERYLQLGGGAQQGGDADAAA